MRVGVVHLTGDQLGTGSRRGADVGDDCQPESFMHEPNASSDSRLRIGSLFSGYGGLDLAVEHVFNAKTVWFSAVDTILRPSPAGH